MAPTCSWLGTTIVTLTVVDVTVSGNANIQTGKMLTLDAMGISI